MNPELELTIVFCLSLVFQVISIKYRETVNGIVYLVIAAVGWMATSQCYLACQPLLAGGTWLFYMLFIVDGVFAAYYSGMIFLYGVPDDAEEIVIG